MLELTLDTVHTSLQTTHPLAQSLARLHQLNPYLQGVSGKPQGEGWFRPADFLASDSPLFASLLEESQRIYQSEAATVLAPVLFDIYQWPLIAVSIALYLSENRIPDLSPDNVWLHLHNPDGELPYCDQIAFVHGRFAALPSDIDATHPDAFIVSDQDSLRTYLRRQIEHHLAAVIEGIRAHLPVGPRLLWPAAADRCASTVLWIGQDLPGNPLCPSQLQDEIRALVHTPGSPLANRITGIMAVSCTHADGEEEMGYFLQRASCCFAYKTGKHPYCSTCPKRPMKERIDQLQSYLINRRQMAAGEAV